MTARNAPILSGAIPLKSLLVLLYRHFRKWNIAHQEQLERRAATLALKREAKLDAELAAELGRIESGKLAADTDGSVEANRTLSRYEATALEELDNEGAVDFRMCDLWDFTNQWLKARFTITIPDNCYALETGPFELALAKYVRDVGCGTLKLPSEFSAEIARLDELGAAKDLLAEIRLEHSSIAKQIDELPAGGGAAKSKAKKSGKTKQTRRRPKRTAPTENEMQACLGRARGLSLAQIGHEMGVTKQRVHQLLDSAKKRTGPQSRPADTSDAVELRGDYSADKLPSQRVPRQR